MAEIGAVVYAGFATFIKLEGSARDFYGRRKIPVRQEILSYVICFFGLLLVAQVVVFLLGGFLGNLFT